MICNDDDDWWWWWWWWRWWWFVIYDMVNYVKGIRMFRALECKLAQKKKSVKINTNRKRGEWINKWRNEWRNKWMNERRKKRVNKWRNKWTNEGTNEWMNEWMKEQTNEGTNGQKLPYKIFFWTPGASSAKKYPSSAISKSFKNSWKSEKKPRLTKLYYVQPNLFGKSGYDICFYFTVHHPRIWSKLLDKWILKCGNAQRAQGKPKGY